MKIWTYLKPDWHNLTAAELKSYRTVGFVLFAIGAMTLSKNLDTIKIFTKLVGATMLGIGIQYVLTTYQLLKNKGQDS